MFDVDGTEEEQLMREESRYHLHVLIENVSKDQFCTHTVRTPVPAAGRVCQCCERCLLNELSQHELSFLFVQQESNQLSRHAKSHCLNFRNPFPNLELHMVANMC